eukprot:m.15114 g.15114  ORF g.15114 m.15114 type:complete len:269 (-) comp6514_c0_seq1:172-978(-)
MFCIAIITRASQRPNNMSEAIEHLRLVVRECFVYKLPPRPSNSGYRADKWGLSNPLWTGRMKITATDSLCTINLLDPKDGSLFAQAPLRDGEVDKVVERVIDSSRYFVLRVENKGRHAYLGVGFQERADAFDFNMALQDFKKGLTREKEASKPYVAQNDCSLKEGETIKIAFKMKKKTEEDEGPADPVASIPMVSLSLDGLQSQSPFAATAAPVASPAASSTNPFAPTPDSAAAPTSANASNPFEADWAGFGDSGAKPAAEQGDWVAF